MKRALHLLGVLLGGALATGPLWGVIGAIVVLFQVTQHLGQDTGKNFDAIVAAIIRAVEYLVLGAIAWPIGATLCAYCLVRWRGKSKNPPPLPSATVSPPPISKSHS